MKDITSEVLTCFEDEIPLIFKNGVSVRQHQVQMALDVADFLFNSKKQIMFLEAPVGTGKSLGVLVPCSIYSREKKNSILYATSTINLQNQIFDVDSTTLEKLKLIDPKKKLLAQGKSNYTCRSCFFENLHKFSRKEQDQILRFFKKSKFGLLSELEELYPEIDQKKHKYLSMDRLSERCFDLQCPSHNHRSEYKKNYQLVITNHNQLNQSYANERKGFSPIVNFKENVLIIDEAHSFKENFLSSIEETYSLKKLYKLKIHKKKKQYFNILKKLSKIYSNYIDENVDSSSLRYKIKSDDKFLLQQLLDILNDNLIAFTLKTNYPVDVVESMSTASDFLSIFLKSNRHKNWIQFDNGDLSLHIVDFNFNRQFQEYISYLASYSKIIFMSGTLTTQDHESDINVDWNLRTGKYVYKNYPSIFSLDKQTIVYIPKDYPNPNDPQHLIKVQNELPEMISFF